MRPLLAALFACLAACVAAGSQPLRLDPGNQHYFSFRRHPTVLVTSGEHYGAVLNLDFNYRLYSITGSIWIRCAPMG